MPSVRIWRRVIFQKCRMITMMYTYSFELDEVDRKFAEAYAEETE